MTERSETPTTRPNLDDLDRLAEGATPGPWVNYSPNPKITREHAIYSEWLETDPEARSSEIAALLAPRDAEFISAARTAVPALTSAIRAVLALVDEWGRDSSLTTCTRPPTDYQDARDDERVDIVLALRKAITEHMEVDR